MNENNIPATEPTFESMIITERHLKNAEIDAHPMLDADHRKLLKFMRTHRKRSGGAPITFMEYAGISLRAEACDYAATTTDAEMVVHGRRLDEAAVRRVYEAIQNSDDPLIKESPIKAEILAQLALLIVWFP